MTHKATIDLRSSKRYRRPKTFSYWGERDGLFLGKKSEGREEVSCWYFFDHGDIVEFKDPNTGKLCRRTVIIEHGHHDEADYGHVVTCHDAKAFVKVGRKKTRVTKAPVMRLVRK